MMTLLEQDVDTCIRLTEQQHDFNQSGTKMEMEEQCHRIINNTNRIKTNIDKDNRSANNTITNSISQQFGGNCRSLSNIVPAIFRQCCYVRHCYVFLILISSITTCTDGARVSADYNTVTSNTKPELPTFKTSSQVFKVIEHETVVLPCEVTQPGKFVLAWKRGIAVLSAGSVKVTPEPRLRLINGYNLEITDAQPQDAGDYTCQIGTLEPREITHTLEILVPPQIEYMTSNGKVEVKKDSSIRLECRASGNPEPVITWTRRNNLLPSGEKSRVSPTLTLERVDRHQAGVYQCTANNGIGHAATGQINVHVLYPPEITVERPIVYSGEGLEAHLVCIVYGETQPEVHWYRDTMLLDTTERRIMETRGSRHTLIIRKVHPSDFGNYTCVADNQLGKARKVIELTGRPNSAVFRSSTLGQWRDRYNISWMVESHAPLEELKLYYRKLPDQMEPEQLQPLQHQSQQTPRRYPKKESGTGGGSGSGSLMYGLASTSYHHRGGPGEWHDVLITATRDRQPPNSYLIRGLEPQSLYEAKIQTRNKYGWSPVSQSFTFQTTSTDNLIRDVEVYPSYNNIGSIASSTSSHTISSHHIQFQFGHLSLFVFYYFLLQ